MAYLEKKQSRSIVLSGCWVELSHAIDVWYFSKIYLSTITNPIPTYVESDERLQNPAQLRTSTNEVKWSDPINAKRVNKMTGTCRAQAAITQVECRQCLSRNGTVDKNPIFELQHRWSYFVDPQCLSQPFCAWRFNHISIQVKRSEFLCRTWRRVRRHDSIIKMDSLGLLWERWLNSLLLRSKADCWWAEGFSKSMWKTKDDRSNTNFSQILEEELDEKRVIEILKILTIDIIRYVWLVVTKTCTTKTRSQSKFSLSIGLLGSASTHQRDRMLLCPQYH